MKSTTSFSLFRYIQSRLHLLVILSCVGLALLGHMPESSAGWLEYFSGEGNADFFAPAIEDTEHLLSSDLVERICGGAGLAGENAI